MRGITAVLLNMKTKETDLNTIDDLEGEQSFRLVRELLWQFSVVAEPTKP